VASRRRPQRLKTAVAALTASRRPDSPSLPASLVRFETSVSLLRERGAGASPANVNRPSSSACSAVHSETLDKNSYR